MYDYRVRNVVITGQLNVLNTAILFIFRTAECTFPTAEHTFPTAERTFRSGECIFRNGERTFRSAEYKTSALPF